MALVVCKNCKKVFINSPQNEQVCPECALKLREIYPIVRNFLRNNERRLYSALEVSTILNISLKDINGLISMGLIDDGSEEKTQPVRHKGPDITRDGENFPVRSNTGMHVYHKRKLKGGSK